MRPHGRAVIGLFVVLLSLLGPQSAPTFPLLSDEWEHARIAFLTLHWPWTKLSILPSNVAGNMNSNFNMNFLKGSIGLCICGVLLVVPDGPISAIMGAFQHWQRYSKSQVEPLGQSIELSSLIVASRLLYIL